MLVAIVAAAFYLGRRTASRSIPEYELLTARPGIITGARFSPDRSSVLYSGAWGGPPRVFVRRLDSPEAAPFGLSPASILSLSSKGEAAILLTHDRVYSYAEGTLARVPLTGGTPRAVLEGVSDADWGPDGESLCVQRSVDGQWRLEFPIGNVLLREWAQFPRVSPDGQRVAFKNQEGELEVVDRAGGRRSLGGRDLYILGLAWGPGGDEIWFSGSSRGADRALWAVDLAGSRRLLASGAGSLTILDVAADGEALVMTGFGRLGLRVRTPDESEERELATPARSTPVALSSDGRTVLIREYLRGAGVNLARLGARGEALLAASDGSSSVRLGPGQALTLSPDGKWALCLQGPPPRLVEVPSGPGEVRVVPIGPLQPDGGWGPARWSADGRTLFVAAQEPGRPRRIFARRDGAGWRAVTPEGTEGDFVVSSEGQRLATTGPSGLVTLYALEAEPPRELPATLGVTVVHWTEDGQALYVRTPASAPAVLERLDLRSGRRQPLMELMPDNPDGVGEIQAVLFTPNGRSYAYSYNRIQSDLYLVTGLE
jgi:dipeptidyl aminopeptidase/acylaminoacyl peptidase